MREEKETEKKYECAILIILYIVGIAITGITVTQFWFTSQKQSSLLSYEERLNSAYSLRDDLEEASAAYGDSLLELYAIDKTVEFENKSGIITEEQANNTIDVARSIILRALSSIVNKILIWDPTITTIWAPNGVYVVREDIRWLFSDGYIKVAWLPRWYNEIALVDERFSWWNNTIYEANWWNYQYTSVLLEGSSPAVENYDGAIDFGINWFYFEVYYWVYDSYIEETLLEPKFKLEKELGLLQVATFATTIGVLLLGFVLDFGERHKLKYFYIGIIIFTLSWSFAYTVFPFI